MHKNYEELICYIFHLPLETAQELTQDSGLYMPLTHSSAIALRAMLFQIQACIYKTTNKRSRSKKHMQVIRFLAVTGKDWFTG
jgi:hypothetical protein